MGIDTNQNISGTARMALSNVKFLHIEGEFQKWSFEFTTLLLIYTSCWSLLSSLVFLQRGSSGKGKTFTVDIFTYLICIRSEEISWQVVMHIKIYRRIAKQNLYRYKLTVKLIHFTCSIIAFTKILKFAKAFFDKVITMEDTLSTFSIFT